MANHKTHPEEWGRLLDLLNKKRLTKAESKDLKTIQRLFSKEERVSSRGMPLLILDSNYEVVATAKSIASLARTAGVNESAVRTAIKREDQMVKGVYKGCYVRKDTNDKTEKLEQELPKSSKCVDCGQIKDIGCFRVFKNWRISEACDICRAKDVERKKKD